MSTPTEYNRDQMNEGKLTDDMVTELVKCWQDSHGLEVDGYAGPVTLGSIQGSIPSIITPTEWDKWTLGPLDQQPVNRKGVYTIFGNPGSGKVDQKWKRDNIIECHQSHGNRLPGVPSRLYVHINKQIEPYLREALRRATASCPDYPIERLGGFVFRHIRHNSANPLSLHSWGIAVDINPHWNHGQTFKKGSGPKAWSDEWKAIWPNGVPKAFVQAFQSCGFAWGADWDEDGISHDHSFYDPMHFEWVARNGNSFEV